MQPNSWFIVVCGFLAAYAGYLTNVKKTWECMQPKKRSIWLIVVGGVLAAYAGYLINAAWNPGMDVGTYPDQLRVVLDRPFANYWNENTLKVIGIVLVAYCMAMLIYLTNDKKYMPGREYGSAQFANAKTATKNVTDKVEENNKIFSQYTRLSIDPRVSELNNNTLILGGSGAGKTYREVTPNLLQANSSYVITDPKGEILRRFGTYFRDIGYQVKVINLVDMKQSDCYNPFLYIRKDEDVSKLITNLIANTTPKGANKGDPFWEKSESMYLQALFYYVWMECPEKDRNFNSLLELVAKAEVDEDGDESELDEIMNALAEEKGESHPAVRNYRKVTRGAADTVRSIIISANSRLAPFENQQIKRILSKDEMDIPSIGIGANGDETTKTAVFCVIPDSDKTYNFVVGMLYTQIFQELYYQADFCYDGVLPIQVAFWLDEFANVALPDDFCSLLSTMRGRGISSNIIIQNLAQIKAMFKDTWETIPGNCDTLIYLGGNEQSSHKYISEMLGKMTITKKSSSESRGKNGSSSQSSDVIGRELMTPDEIKKMSRKKCIIFISGKDPIFDNKYETKKHPKWKYVEKAKYVHDPKKNEMSPLNFLNAKAVRYYEKCAGNGENVVINRLTAEEFLSLSVEQCKNQTFLQPEEKEELQRLEQSENVEDFKLSEGTEDSIEQHNPKVSLNKVKKTIVEQIAAYDFSEEQFIQMRLGLEHGLDEEAVLSYFQKDFDEKKMQEMRLVLERLRNIEQVKVN